jgi:hypothetical protein
MLAAQMYLGGAGAQTGWLLFAFGSIFFWVFAWHADLSGWRFRQGKVARVSGEVLRCRGTSYSVGGSDDSPGDPVYAIEYHYTVNGASIGGVSYDTGSCLESPVTVEYLIAAPEISRVAGTRRDLMGPWASLVALIPAIGLALIAGGVRKGALRVRLLREGVPVEGRVAGQSPTGTEIMGRAQYKVAIAFTARGDLHESATVRTTHPEELAIGPGATVLYDPADPRRALPISAFPGQVRDDGRGGFVGGRARSFLVLPAVSLILNAYLIWRNW